MMKEIVSMPRLECNDCRLLNGACDSALCPENIAGFTAYDIYGHLCRFRTLRAAGENALTR